MTSWCGTSDEVSYIEDRGRYWKQDRITGERVYMTKEEWHRTLNLPERDEDPDDDPASLDG